MRDVSGVAGELGGQYPVRLTATVPFEEEPDPPPVPGAEHTLPVRAYGGDQSGAERARRGALLFGPPALQPGWHAGRMTSYVAVTIGRLPIAPRG